MFSKRCSFWRSARYYQRANKLIEAGDWIVMQLTGLERRNACAAGYKAMWHKADGYPSRKFLPGLTGALKI